MQFDPEKHHRRSIRLPTYDYAGSGVYFVTICTQHREMLFGNVRDNAMAMNELGWIVWEEWEKSGDIRKEIELGPFVVMPNHLHGEVTVDPSDEDQASYRQTANVKRQRKPRSLGSFIAGFKATTTYHINALRGISGASLWQRNYYERIIRNEHEMTKVWSYIDFNPWKWMQDRENLDREQDNPIETWLYPAPRDRR